MEATSEDGFAATEEMSAVIPISMANRLRQRAEQAELDLEQAAREQILRCVVLENQEIHRQ